jgi:hypothetical protein
MIKYIILISCFLSCTSSKRLIHDYDIIRFKERVPAGNKSVLQDYLLDVPKGGTIKKINSGDNYKEYRIEYPDSSIIYIMNDKWSGSRLNFSNRYEMNIKAINRKSDQDTLAIGGIQKDKRHWKEKFAGEIVVGYVNAIPNNVEKYEIALSSLRKTK